MSFGLKDTLKCQLQCRDEANSELEDVQVYAIGSSFVNGSRSHAFQGTCSNCTTVKQGLCVA